MPSVDKYTLKPSLTETFRGIIWKVETDSESPVIAIESRDISNRETHYSAFNYQTGECLFKEKTVQDNWFWSLADVHEERVFLHSYMNEASPEHKGIIALNFAGEIQWQQFNITLDSISEEGLVVYNPKVQPRQLELISAADGTRLSGKAHEAKPLERKIVVPGILATGDASILTPLTAVGPIFQLSYRDKNILAFHEPKAGLFDQKLQVYLHDCMLLEDILAESIQKLNPEAFFIERDHLFCIRNNKQEIVSYLV
jgi:hypothetical protein